MRRRPPRLEQGGRAEHIVFTLLVVNGLLIGTTTAAFMQGPYSSSAQEIWYRYGSIALFVVGVVLPGLALRNARRSRPAMFVVSIWLAMALLAFLWFAALSGGGV